MRSNDWGRELYLFLAEQAAQCAQRVTHLIGGDFGLDAGNQGVHLIVGEIHTHIFLDDLGGVLFELLHQILVAEQLFDDFFDLFLMSMVGPPSVICEHSIAWL